MRGRFTRWLWTLPVISGGAVLVCLLYCRFWWTPRPMTLLDPDCSAVCWLYCDSLRPVWLGFGVLFSLQSVLGGLMIRVHSRWARPVTLIAGIPLVPSGLLNLFAWYFSKES